MVLHDNSLIPIANRLPGAPYLTPRGNTSTSMFRAVLANIAGGDVVAYDANQGENIPVLLFTQDTPILMRVVSLYPAGAVYGDDGADTVTFPLIQWFIEQATLQGDTTADSFALLVPGANPQDVQFGQALTAETFTNGVEVTGFPVLVTVTDRNINLGGGEPVELTPSLDMLCFTRGGTLSGPLGTGSSDVSYNGTIDRTCVILNETLYTAAVKAANNTIAVSATHIADVVGIFAVPGV